MKDVNNFILDEIIRFKDKTFLVEFHDTAFKTKEDSVSYIEQYLGKPHIIKKSSNKILAYWKT